MLTVWSAELTLRMERIDACYLSSDVLSTCRTCHLNILLYTHTETHTQSCICKKLKICEDFKYNSSYLLLLCLFIRELQNQFLKSIYWVIFKFKNLRHKNFHSFSLQFFLESVMRKVFLIYSKCLNKCKISSW